MKETVGIIGLGNMGLALATNLLQAGFGLRVYNRTAAKVRPPGSAPCWDWRCGPSSRRNRYSGIQVFRYSGIQEGTQPVWILNT